MDLDIGELANVASGLGGAGLGARVVLHWMGQAAKEKREKAQAERLEALKFNSDRSKILAESMQSIGGVVLVAFAFTALFVLLSPIILPAFANVDVTVYLPRSLDLFVIEIDRLKKIELVSHSAAKGETVRQILILPIHFAFCTNIFGFWVADQGLKR